MRCLLQAFAASLFILTACAHDDSLASEPQVASKFDGVYEGPTVNEGRWDPSCQPKAGHLTVRIINGVAQFKWSGVTFPTRINADGSFSRKVVVPVCEQAMCTKYVSAQGWIEGDSMRLRAGREYLFAGSAFQHDCRYDFELKR
jgi:hypothetical protein